MTPLRLWGIRHIRYAWSAYRLNRALRVWRTMFGIAIPQQSDLDYLDAIWRGDR